MSAEGLGSSLLWILRGDCILSLQWKLVTSSDLVAVCGMKRQYSGKRLRVAWNVDILGLSLFFLKISIVSEDLGCDHWGMRAGGWCHLGSYFLWVSAASFLRLALPTWEGRFRTKRLLRFVPALRSVVSIVATFPFCLSEQALCGIIITSLWPFSRSGRAKWFSSLLHHFSEHSPSIMIENEKRKFHSSIPFRVSKPFY